MAAAKAAAGMRAMQPASPEEADAERTCRICLGSDEREEMIAPCRCMGTARWVHRGCLDEWRAQERVPLAFTQCPTCRFQYVTSVLEKGHGARRCRFRLLVARDATGVFIAVQALVAGTALLLRACDSAEKIPLTFAPHWAETHATMLLVGPYLGAACVLLLAILGLVGVLLKVTGRMPRRPTHINCELCCADPVCTQCYCDCAFNECAALRCGGCAEACDCASCSECFSALSGSGEGAVIFLPIAAALLVILALIGIFVGIFFATVVAQRIAQSHVHLLHRRSETKRVVVLDLADRPELLRADGGSGASRGISAPSLCTLCRAV